MFHYFGEFQDLCNIWSHFRKKKKITNFRSKKTLHKICVIKKKKKRRGERIVGKEKDSIFFPIPSHFYVTPNYSKLLKFFFFCQPDGKKTPFVTPGCNFKMKFSKNYAIFTITKF